LDDASEISESPTVSLDDSETPDEAADVQKSSEKRKTNEKQSGRKGKRRRRDVQESGTPDWQRTFVEMWERSLEQDNARFERSAEMFREAQSRQMEQTNSILAGFKDIFKDLASK